MSYPRGMRARSWLFLSLVVSFPFAFSSGLAACSSDPDAAQDASTAPSGTTQPTGDSSTTKPDSSEPDAAQRDADAAPQKDASSDARTDALCTDAGSTTFGPGDTCAPFGEGSSCGGCFPTYGYVCTNGGPPNVTGCVQVSNSAFGGTYCCPTLACVRVTSEDPKCAGRPGKTKMYSCPVDGAQNLRAQPPQAACEEVAGPTYRYFCCPS